MADNSSANGLSQQEATLTAFKKAEAAARERSAQRDKAIVQERISKLGSPEELEKRITGALGLETTEPISEKRQTVRNLVRNRGKVDNRNPYRYNKATRTRQYEQRMQAALKSEQTRVDALLEIYDNAQVERYGKLAEEGTRRQKAIEGRRKASDKSFNEWTPSENVQNQLKQSVQAPEGGATQGKIQPVTPQQAYGYAGNMAAPAGVLSPEEIQKQADEARKAAEEIAGGRNPHSENAIRELRQRDGVLSENKPAPSQVNNDTNSNAGSIVGDDKKTSNKTKWGKRAGYMGVGMAVLGAAGLAVNSLMINDKGRMNNAQMYGQQPYSQY